MALITKLESSVSDSSLLPIGALVLQSKQVDSVTSAKRFFGIVGPVKMTIVGNGYFTDSSLSQNLGKEVSYTGASEHGVYTSNGNYKIICTSKYDFTRLNLNGEGVYINIDENKFVNNCTIIQAYSSLTEGDISNLEKWERLEEIARNNVSTNGLTGDISVFGKINIQKVRLQLTGVYGDIKNLSSNTRISVLNFTDSKGIYGNVSDISNLVNLTSVLFTGCDKIVGNVSSLGTLVNATLISLNGSGISGTCDELAQALKTNGKTSGTVRIIVGGQDKTYNFPIA